MFLLRSPPFCGLKRKLKGKPFWGAPRKKNKFRQEGGTGSAGAHDAAAAKLAAAAAEHRAEAGGRVVAEGGFWISLQVVRPDIKKTNEQKITLAPNPLDELGP